jgi:hypothetical protein
MRKSLLLGTLILAAVAVGRAEAGNVDVTVPNGGEYWCVGTTQKITWTNISSLNTSKVKIELSRNGTLGPWEVLGSNLTNTKEFAWTVTGPETTKARIKITIGLSSDVSDANFTIENPVFSYPEQTFSIPVPNTSPTPADTSFTLGLIVCKVRPQDPPAAQQFKYKYVYTLKSKDTSTAFPNTYIGKFIIANCKAAFLGLKPKQPNGTEETNWTVNTWTAPATDDVIWSTSDMKANGIGPSKITLIFCVYSNSDPALSDFSVFALRFKNLYDMGSVLMGSFKYYTPGCPPDDCDEEEEGGCVHEFNLAQVYPVDGNATLTGFPDLSCWSGVSSQPIPSSKLAIPGVLCLATNNKGYLDWEKFISGNDGDTCCAYPVVQNIDLLKVSPPSDKCPIFGGYQVRQDGYKNIRTWWPLAYTMPGTTFTLTLQGVCKQGWMVVKPYKETWRWKVVANADTFNHLIDLFHTNALGELEVPSIVGEDIYAALKECAAKLKAAIEALKNYPKNAVKKNAVRDAIMECEAIIICNTLFLDHLDAPEEMTYPYYQAAPKRFLPGNRAIPDPNVQKGGQGGGVIGIIDTDQNPAACKLIVDLEWINNLIFGKPGY